MEKITVVDFLTSAEEELRDAVVYYNDQSEGLGFEFAAEVLRTVDRIVRFPLAWTSLSARTRRCRMNRFPFGIIYQMRLDRILIVSVMHMKREPHSWRKSLPTSKQ